MALTRKDLARSIQMKTGFTELRSLEIVESVTEVIKSTLEGGDDVLISGFGKFRVKQKNIRRGRNPANGLDMILKARKVVTFRCSGKLRRKINGKE
jgi:integration host factor subunit alpha